MKVMSLASLEAKRTLIRAACFEHKHSGSNILRNLFSSHMKCSRRRHTVISDTRVLRNTTIANSLKKKTCKAHKYGYCRRSNELAEKGASIAFKVTLQRNTQTCTKTGWTVWDTGKKTVLRRGDNSPAKNGSALVPIRTLRCQTINVRIQISNCIPNTYCEIPNLCLRYKCSVHKANQQNGHYIVWIYMIYSCT